MATQKTIAIIGVFDDSAATAIRKLSDRNYHLLLFYRDGDKDRQADEAQVMQASAAIEWLSCPIEASWEADAILLAIPDEEQAAIASAIRAVTTGKPVVDIRNNLQNQDLLQELFPDSIVQHSAAESQDFIEKIFSLLK